MSLSTISNYFIFIKEDKLPNSLKEKSKPATLFVFDKENIRIIVNDGILTKDLWSNLHKELLSISNKNDRISSAYAGKLGEELEIYRNHLWIYNDNPEYDTPEKRYSAAVDAFIEKEHSILNDLIDKTERSNEYLKYLYTQSKEAE